MDGDTTVTEMTVVFPWNRPAFDRLTAPACCGRCGRRTPLRKDGQRIRHRVEADNPLAPYCEGDSQ